MITSGIFVIKQGIDLRPQPAAESLICLVIGKLRVIFHSSQRRRHGGKGKVFAIMPYRGTGKTAVFFSIPVAAVLLCLISIKAHCHIMCFQFLYLRLGRPFYRRHYAAEDRGITARPKIIPYHKDVISRYFRSIITKGMSDKRIRPHGPPVGNEASAFPFPVNIQNQLFGFLRVPCNIQKAHAAVRIAHIGIGVFADSRNAAPVSILLHFHAKQQRFRHIPQQRI